MRHLLYILIVILLFNAQNHVYGQRDELYEYSKEEKLVYSGNDFSGIEIHNQHGGIDVTASAADTFMINILISVKEENHELGTDVLDKIDIRKSKTGNNLYLRTNFGTNFQANHPFTIHYDIHMPAGKNVIINNRFGDIHINSIAGNQSVVQEYGNLYYSGLEPIDSVNLDLSFVDAELGKFKNAKMKFYNVNAKADNINNATIEGRYCQLDLPEAGDLSINSETSRFSIGSVKKLSLKGTFCFASIGKLDFKGDIEISNGLLIISSVSTSVTELSIFNQNAPINLNLPENLSYTLHGEVTNGHFQHYASDNFRIIKESGKTSFSGEYHPEPNSAAIVLFNENAGIIIEK